MTSGTSCIGRPKRVLRARRRPTTWPPRSAGPPGGPPVRGPGAGPLGVRPRAGARRHRGRHVAAADQSRCRARPGRGRRRGDVARGARGDAAARAAPRPCSPTTSTCRSAARWSSAASAARPRGTACRATTSSRWRWSPATGEQVTCSPDRQPEPVRRGARGARAGGGHHQGDAPARSGADAGPPVPAVLPRPGDDAGRPAAAGRTSTGSSACRARCWPPRPAAGRSGSTSQRAFTGGPAGRRRAARRPVRRPARGAAEHAALPRLPRPARRAGAALRSNGQWWFPHPWLTTFVGDAAVESVVGGELAGLTAGRPGPARPGRALPDPPGAGHGARCCGCRRTPLCYTFNLIRHPGDRRRRRGAAARDGQPRGLRAGPGRRRDAVPGQRLPHVPADWRRALRAGLRPRSATPSASTTRATCSPPATRCSDREQRWR